tara:strand:+ start:318 stop:998 length:681 start_codon:yes stop_codon:yes gene_type:complete
MDIYWSLDHRQAIGALRVGEIEPVLKNKPVAEYRKCPAFRDYFHNVYGWKSLYTYSLRRDGDSFKSDLYDQDFFDRFFWIRSVDDQLLSFQQGVSFITDSSSLKLSIEHPYFEDSKFTSSCYTIPGTLDIGRYYRRLDFAFHIKKDHDTFAVDEGDILFYLRFHTEEKINFKQYYMTDKLREYQAMITDVKWFVVPPTRPLKYFYQLYEKSNLRTRILKEIKRNLV